MVTKAEAKAELERRATISPEAARAEIQRRQLAKEVPTSPIEDTVATTVEAGARGLLQGATLGFSDELAAPIGAAFVKGRELLPEVLGGIEDTGKSFSELTEEGKGELRTRQKQLREVAPATTLATEIIGGVATGGVGLAKTAALKGVAGFGAKVASGGALGAVSGAGFSEGENASAVLSDAVKGGLLGGATAGILSAAISVGSPLVKKTINRILSSKSPDKFSQAEQFIANKIADGTAPELADALAKAKAAGLSIPLAGVSKSPSLGRTTAALAQNVKTEDIARKSIKNIENTLTRAERNILSDISKNVATPQEGAEVFSNGLKSLKDGLIEARRLKAAPLYTKSVQANNRLRPNVVEGLKAFKTRTGTTNPLIGDAITELRKSGAFVDLPDNSMPVLDAVFKKLGADAQATKNTFERTLMKDAQKKLRTAIAQKFPTYEKAVKTFSDESGVLNQLTANKKNPLAKLISASDADAVSAVKNVFSQQPEEIIKMRNFAISNNLGDAFDAGVKSNIMEKINSAVSQGSSMSSVFRSPKARQQLVASVGKDRANSLQEVMKSLDDFRDFKRITQGSQTQPLQAAESEIAFAAQRGGAKVITSGAKILAKAKDVAINTDKSIAELAAASEDPRFRQEVANILFDRKRGKVFIDKIINAKNEREKRKGIGALLSTAADKLKKLDGFAQRELTPAAIITQAQERRDVQ